jgi:hypothetical protein
MLYTQFIVEEFLHYLPFCKYERYISAQQQAQWFSHQLILDYLLDGPVCGVTVYIPLHKCDINNYCMKIINKIDENCGLWYTSSIFGKPIIRYRPSGYLNTYENRDNIRIDNLESKYRHYNKSYRMGYMKASTIFHWAQALEYQFILLSLHENYAGLYLATDKFGECCIYVKYNHHLKQIRDYHYYIFEQFKSCSFPRE